MPSDEELMVAYAAGDERAFAEIFRRYAPLLLRVMRQQLWAPEEANDLVQQTFLQLHRARREFDPKLTLRPWLFTIAMNLKRQHLRQLRRYPAALDAEGERDSLVGPSGHPRTEAQLALAHALPRLPADQSEVIALHWFGGLSFPEIALVVGATPTAVKVRAHRGYVALRQLLGAREAGALPPADGGNPQGAGDISSVLDVTRSTRGLR